MDYLNEWLGLTIVLFGLVLLTLTRARAIVWISWGSTLVWLGVAYYFNQQTRTLVLATPLLFILVGWVIHSMPTIKKSPSAAKPSELTAVVNVGRDPGDWNTMNRRLPLWRSVISMSRHKWLLGVGHGCFWVPIRSKQAGEWGPISSHSAYLDVFIENGIIGLALFLLILCTVVFAALGLPAPHGIFLIAITFFFAVNGLLESGLILGDSESFLFLTIVTNIAYYQ